MAPTAEYLDRASLAALGLIAHELNNIAVPLDGFAEYALQHLPRHRVVRECVHEFQIGIGRIRVLASDLESLGETAVVREVIALGDCLGRTMLELQCVVPPIEWCCSEDISVHTDPVHARRAISALIRVTLANDSTLNPAAVTITQKGAAPSNCVMCDASLTGKEPWVFLDTSGIGRLSPEVLRDPFRSDSGGRTSRRLALAVLDRCAHRAGGHVILDEHADLLVLALPVAG